MEAQYALQKKKALVPLMLTQGYEADGWLGLLLGTSIWYGFYGDALSSERGFEDRMAALCRELGMRGRADASQSSGAPAAESALHAELRSMKVTQLKRRAREAGGDAQLIEETDDAEVPKAALIELIVGLENAAD
jgi:hypothetical protein